MRNIESHPSNLVSVLLTQRQKYAEDHGTAYLNRGTMGSSHSFTCPYHGQSFLCVKKWFEAEISGVLPDVFSYISHFVCLISIILVGRFAALVTLGLFLSTSPLRELESYELYF